METALRSVSALRLMQIFLVHAHENWSLNEQQWCFFWVWDDCEVKGRHKVIACCQENLEGRLKMQKVVKKKSWRKFSIALEGGKESGL